MILLFARAGGKLFYQSMGVQPRVAIIDFYLIAKP
jgi:hypothetical protein